jgi:PhzF family phenazine biosynthesis protein
MDTAQFKDFAQALVECFYPLVEASLFTHEGKLVELLNPFSQLKEDQELDSEQSHQKLKTGRQVKQLIHPFKAGFLRLRFDMSQFHSLKSQLDQILQMQNGQVEQDGWQAQVDHLLDAYLKEQRITMVAASAKQKREMIKLLADKKLFDFKEASVYIATKMEMSRATIYNYLKTIQNLQKVKIHQVDAFTNQKFGGNPAGVVLDAETLDDAVMRKIARELNLSETSFVLPSQKADFRLRYFTPTGHEVPFCGHSTVGALFVIAHEKKFQVERAGLHRFHVETLSGILKMEAKINADETIEVGYEPPKVHLSRAKTSHEEVAKMAGIKLEWIDVALPVMYDKASHGLFITVRSLQDLKRLQCDFKSLTLFAKKMDAIVICFLTKETFDSQNQIHMRCFAPLVGINEDPFTGSILGGLTAYVDQCHLLPPKTTAFRVEQGHFLDRPGFVKVEFLKQGKDYQIKVFAKAVHCFATEINLT